MLEKQKRTQYSLIKERVIIKMQLILIAPLVPPRFVLEISEAKACDHINKSVLALASSLPLWFPSPLILSLSLAPSQGVTCELKGVSRRFLTLCKNSQFRACGLLSSTVWEQHK